MGYLVGIDAGGTFTDCVAASTTGDNVVSTKVSTTQYDLLVAFTRGLQQVAEELSLPTEQFLDQCELIVYSSTQETNALIERRGARVGLITTKGFEDTLLIQRAKGAVDGLSELDYKRQGRKSKPVPIVSRDMVVGVQERIDCFGQVQIPLDEEEVHEGIQQLVDKGAEVFVVCLLQSIRNSAHERGIKEIIKREFPMHHLGSVPVVLSSEVSPAYREYPRMNTSVIAGFLRGRGAETLKTFQEHLLGRTRRPLLVMQNYGGASKITKSNPVSCLHSGPVAGSINGEFTHRHYKEMFGTESAIFTDVGGTSFDVTLMIDGAIQTDFEPIVDRFRLQTPLVRVNSIGAGGGTIAKVDQITGRLDVGPESAGALPGPACYGLGGTRPTITDADAVLGRINPDYFLGGKLQLHPDLGRKAIQAEVAEPLGLSVDEAALSIVRLIDNKMANLVEKEVLLKGRDPRDFVLYSYGGAGATHCCGFVESLRPKAIIVPNRSSVFSAYGAAISSIRHKYWQAIHFELWDPQTGFADDFEAFNQVCARLEKSAANDMRAEGFSEGGYELQFEFEMKYGPMLWEYRTSVPVKRLEADNAALIKDIFTDAFVQEFGEATKFETGGIVVEGVILTVTGRITDARLESLELRGEDASDARIGSRPVIFSEPEPVDTNIYRLELLHAGNKVVGPSIIEATDTTYVVPPGWEVGFDEYMSGLLREVDS